MSEAELRELAGREAAKRPVSQPTMLESIETALLDYDVERFRRRIGLVIDELEPLQLIETILLPILRTIGAHWEAGRLDVGMEHLLTEVVRAHLVGRIDGLRVAAKGPTIGFATLSGEHHELGVLMACFLAAARRNRTLYFGANMPPDQLARSAMHQDVDLIVLSSIFDAERSMTHLKSLALALPPNVPIWLGCARGGARARALPDNVSLFHDFATFHAQLEAHF